MSIGDTPIESINEATLKMLIADEVDEQLRIEYKAELKYATNDDKKEFLRDVSSFANTAGGDTFFGISETKGKPVRIDGLVVADTDKLTSTLEQMIRDGLEPKLSGHRVRPIRLQSGNYVIVVRIPRSYAAPHRVRFQSTPQFWARRSNGKYYLDANELRNAFLLSETAAERIRAFRIDRVSKLLAGQGPVILEKGPKLIFHLIPLDAFQTGRFVDINSIKDQVRSLGAIDLGGDGPLPNHVRFNLDGFLVSHTRGGDPKQGLACCQWFRNGIVESFGGLSSDAQKLYWNVFEDSLPNSVKRFLEVQKKLGIQPPIVALLTVCDVRDFTMVIETSYQATFGSADPIDRDLLLVPEVMIESFECDLETQLRPIIDAVWNAAGHAKSPVKREQRG